MSFVPVALTATLLLTEGREVQPQDVLLPVFGAVFAHAAGNLVNTWVDHKSGLDTPSRADDRSLVDGIVSPNTVAGLAIACLTVAGAVCGYYVEVRGVATFLPVAAAGIAIGVFYTAKPISLKYNGLGDMAVFTAFGPLVMAGASLAMVGRVPASVLTLSLGVGLLTTGILVRTALEPRALGLLLREATCTCTSLSPFTRSTPITRGTLRWTPLQARHRAPSFCTAARHAVRAPPAHAEI